MMRTVTSTGFALAPRRALAAAVAAVAFALAMVSCGGGGVGSGGTGAPETNFGLGSYGSGTVTGFGSLVVDGIVYDDTQVPVTVEAQPNVLTSSTAKLGHFIELEFNDDSGREVIRAIHIEAAAVGRIDAVDAAEHSLTVLGQTIVENTSADAGPITFYSGLAGLSALRVGDTVEVYGVHQWNERSDRYEIVATRIERLPAPVAVHRLSGVVQSESASGSVRRFRLGGLQITHGESSTLPAGVLPREGDVVIVWSDRPVISGSLAASAVRVVARTLQAPGKDARLAGTASRHDASGRRFDLAGVVVRYGDAKFSGGNASAIANGVYVVVEGAYAADGALDARRVKIRKRGAPDEVEVELTGRIESFVSTGDFIVRNTRVDAQGVSRLQGCGDDDDDDDDDDDNGNRATLRNGLHVRIEGQVQSGANGSVVRANSVRCVN
jgi:Domain of unknown function (DUF5666)